MACRSAEGGVCSSFAPFIEYYNCCALARLPDNTDWVAIAGAVALLCSVVRNKIRAEFLPFVVAATEVALLCVSEFPFFWKKKINNVFLL